MHGDKSQTRAADDSPTQPVSTGPREAARSEAHRRVVVVCKRHDVKPTEKRSPSVKACNRRQPALILVCDV